MATADEIRAELLRREMAKRQQAPAVAPAADEGIDVVDVLTKLSPLAGIIKGAPQIARGEVPTESPMAQVIEPAAAIASGIVAEPVAGLAGIRTGLVTQDAQKAAEAVEATREALTFQPRTEAGKEGLQAVGEAVAPVGEALQKIEKGLGDAVFEATDSPALAAAATALPAATMEALGFGVARKVAKTGTQLKSAPKKVPTPKQVSEKQVTKALVEAAPEIDDIKNASRAIYKEIDNLDVDVKPIAIKMMANKAIKRAGRVNPTLTPKSAEVVRLLRNEVDDFRPRKLSDFDEVRKMAQIAAQSPDASDARIGAMMVDEIDEFLDNMPQKAFSGADAKTIGNIGERYKAARGLWGRARRAELINDAMDKAGRQASGFENGIRTQLRQILNNKKRSRFFSKNELAAMDDVVKGTDSANILKLVGRLGFSEGSATNVLGGLVGMGILGPVAPVAGQVSRKFAQKVTQGAFNRVESLVRSGADSRKIAQAYLQSVPKGKRSAMELSDLLLSSGSDVDELLTASRQVSKEAAEIARARKMFQQAEAVGAGVPAAATTALDVTEQEQE